MAQDDRTGPSPPIDSLPQNGKPAKARASLHMTLLRLFLFLVAATATTIGLPAYLNLRWDVERLSRNLLHESAEQTTARTREYFRQALPPLRLGQKIMQADAGYLPDKPSRNSWRSRARLFEQILGVHGDFTQLYFGDAQGDFSAAVRMPDGSIQIDHRWIETGTSRRECFRSDGSSHWTPIYAEPITFDPRNRPWYRQAAEAKARIWTVPYVYSASKQIGITVAAPLYGRQKQLLGVLGEDYDLSVLDQFVRDLHPAETGKAFLLLDVMGRQKTIARPESSVPLHFQQVPDTLEDPDPIVRSAAQWRSRQSPKVLNRRTSVSMVLTTAGERYLGATSALKLDNQTVRAIVVVLESDALWTVNRNNAIALGTAAAALAAAALMAGWLASQMARPLNALSREMSAVGRLEFSDEPLPPSAIEEVFVMQDGLERMKIGLRAFEKYVPTDLVRAIIASEHSPALGGECVQVSILFSDIVNFTGASERLSPADLVETLAMYLEIAEEVVWTNGGIVDKYIGDAVMALWATPIRPQGQGAISACDAALKYVAELENLRRKLEERGLTSFTLCIGIHTGEALVGNIGSLRRFNYTAMGDTVNVASRLEHLNRMYGTQILITESTYSELHEQFEVRLIDYVAVKGRIKPVVVYELLARAGELKPGLKSVVEAYNRGWALYRTRNWDAAEAAFAEALDASGGRDSPSRLFLERCRTYRAAPPPEDWNGAFVPNQK